MTKLSTLYPSISSGLTSEISGNWESTYSTVETNSATWDSAYQPGDNIATADLPDSAFTLVDTIATTGDIPLGITQGDILNITSLGATYIRNGENTGTFEGDYQVVSGQSISSLPASGITFDDTGLTGNLSGITDVQSALEVFDTFEGGSSGSTDIDLSYTSSTSDIYLDDDSSYLQMIGSGGVTRVYVGTGAHAFTKDKEFLILNNITFTAANLAWLIIGDDNNTTYWHKLYAGSSAKIKYDSATGYTLIECNGQQFLHIATNNTINLTQRSNLHLGKDSIAYNYGTGIGYSANGADYGASLGSNSAGNNYGASLGASSQSSRRGVAVGYSTTSYYDGIAIGYDSDARYYGVAIGNQAKAQGSSDTPSDGGISIGYKAGYNQSDHTGKLIIDNYARSGESDEEDKSIIFGQMDSDADSQNLKVNADLEIRNDLIHNGSNVGFYGQTPNSQQSVSTTHPTPSAGATYTSAEQAIINALVNEVGELRQILNGLGLISN